MKHYTTHKYCLICCILLLLSCFLVSCSNDEADDKIEKIIDEPSLKNEAKAIFQFSDYTEESKLVRITIKDYGDICVKLFPEYAPKAVERFLELVDDDYYDDLPLCRAIDNYLIQSGSEADEEKVYFEDEFNVNLHPYRGALCMANEGSDNTNSNEFMIIQSDADFLESLEELVEYKGYTLSEYLHTAYGTNLSDSQMNSYMIYGGAPWLYGHHTVFGQMYDGFDVLDSIVKVETSDDYVPTTDIIIEDIEILQ